MTGFIKYIVPGFDKQRLDPKVNKFKKYHDILQEKSVIGLTQLEFDMEGCEIPYEMKKNK